MQDQAVSTFGDERLCESPVAKKVTAALREVDKALKVMDTMPAKLRAGFMDRTITEARRDPVFRMYARRLRAPTPRRSPRPMTTGCSRPRERRAGASSSSSSADPGDPDPLRPAPLALAPPSRAVLAYACLSAERRGELVMS